MRTVELRVSKLDITTGECGDASKCAISKALMRAGFRKPRVGYGLLCFTRGNKRFKLKIPQSAQDFIAMYDSKGKDACQPTVIEFSY